MIRTLIVDDEPLARRGLALRLAAYPDFSVVAECENGHEAISAIQQLKPDLVFLDIQMPGIDGFGVLANIDSSKLPAIVFLTAYDEYALAAFEVQALDYLLKPIDKDRLASAIGRVRELLTLRQIASLQRQVAGLLQLREERNGPIKRFAVRERGRVFFVSAEDVDWIEAIGDYAGLHVGDRTHLLRESLTSLEARLNPEQFARIHRSSIVRLDRVAEVRSRKNRDLSIVLKNGQRLSVSRTYSDRLRSAVQ